MKKYFFIIILVVLIIGTFKFIEFNKKEETVNANNQNMALEKVSIIFSKNTESVTFLYDFLSDNAYFEKQGLEVEYVESVKNGFQTFMSGGSDFFAGGINNASAAYLNGGEPRVVADIGKISNVYLVSKYEREEAQLIKKIAVSGANTSTGMVAKQFLKTLGVEPESVEFLTVKTISERVAALSSGQADAIIAQSYTELRDAGALDKYSVFPVDIIKEELPYDKYLTTTKEVIETKPKLVEKFVKSYYEGIMFIKTNPAFVKKYMVEKYNYTSDEAESLYKSLIESQQKVEFVPDQNRVFLAAEDAKKEMEIKSDRDLSDFIYANFASTASQKID